MDIREAVESDWPAVWDLFRGVAAAGGAHVIGVDFARTQNFEPVQDLACGLGSFDRAAHLETHVIGRGGDDPRAVMLPKPPAMGHQHRLYAGGEAGPEQA